MAESNTCYPASARGRLALVILAVLSRLTKRHRLYVVEHTGRFAGSLLHRGDWDNK